MIRIMKAMALLAVLVALIVGGSAPIAAAHGSTTSAQSELALDQHAIADNGEGGGAGILGPCNYSGSHPTIRWGDRGSVVVHAQCLMRNLWGYTSLAVDGDFGPITHATVLDIQDRAGLVIDGVVGPCTWKALHFEYIPPECRR